MNESEEAMEQSRTVRSRRRLIAISALAAAAAAAAAVTLIVVDKGSDSRVHLADPPNASSTSAPTTASPTTAAPTTTSAEQRLSRDSRCVLTVSAQPRLE